MNRKIIDRLRPVTDEERKIIENGGRVDQTIYKKNRLNIYDADLLLAPGKLMDLRVHTRFAHFPRHRHNYVEMVYMASGMTRHLINGKEVLLRQGELLLMNQHATQEIFPARENDIAINFVIRPEFFDSTLLLLGENQSLLRDFLIDCLRSSSGDVDYLHFQVADQLAIQNLLENLVLNLLEEPSNGHVLNSNTMGLLFLYLLQCTDQLAIGSKHPEEEVIMMVYRQLEENYKDGQLSDISQAFDMELYEVSRIIKKKTGKTYTDLLQEKRLTQAAYLLSTTRLPVTDICVSVGYNNISYFYQLFKKKYGMTPYAWGRSFCHEDGPFGSSH